MAFEKGILGPRRVFGPWSCALCRKEYATDVPACLSCFPSSSSSSSTTTTSTFQPDVVEILSDSDDSDGEVRIVGVKMKRPREGERNRKE